jgi:ABC-type multidrug transport system fused ATPase/permease subunit
MADLAPAPRYDGSIKRLSKELRPFRGLVALCGLLTILTSGLGLLPPIILGDIVNRLQKGESVNTLLYLAMITGFAALQGLLGYASGVAISTLGQNFLISLRDRMLGHMQRLPMAYFEKNQTGKLVSNVINDAGTVNQLITSNGNQMLNDAVQLTFVFIYLLNINPLLTLMALSVAPFYVWNFRHFWKPLQDTSEDIRGKRDAMYGQMQEKLVGIQTVKGFGQERAESRAFMSTTRELMGLNIRQGALGGGLWTLADALCGVATGLVLAYGGWLCLHDKMGAGTLVTFLSLSVGYVYGPIVRFLTVLDPIARAQAAMARIFRTLDTDNPIKDKPGALPMPKIEGRVKFESVWFEYEPNQPVLKGIELDVLPGQTVALVGFSGSGKTTMTALLLRNYDPTSGKLTVDGIDLRDVQIESFRKQVGVVAQESVLFNTTVRENIRYGRINATDQEIEDAARAASIHDAIMGLQDGYETRIGEDGIKLSVGEKQRMAIARALLADPRILILDEATSSLDSATEALLQAALDNLMKGRTSFVVAHRLSTIVRADQIVVLEQGIVTECGSHAELLDKGGLYSRLYKEQFRVALQG